MTMLNQWLNENNLDNYFHLLQKFNLNLHSLTILNEDNLRDIGISDSNDRTRFLKAIQKLKINGENHTSSPSASSHSYDTEYRYITFLICDIVESTKNIYGKDIENSYNLINGLLNNFEKPFSHYYGHVLEGHGDSIEGIFGYPSSSESDAERAIRCSIEIIKVLDKFNSENKTTFKIRIGVASGLCFADIFDHGYMNSPRKYFGEVAHICSRIQSVAEPNCILVNKNTYSLTRNLFYYEAKGKHQLKGIKKKQKLWGFQDEFDFETRFQGRKKETKLFGRKSELSSLKNIWSIVNEKNESAIVLICGEAGVGKSRLCHEFIDSHPAESVDHLLIQSSQLQSETPFFPFYKTIESQILDKSPKLNPANLESRIMNLIKLLKLDSAEIGNDILHFFGINTIDNNNQNVNEEKRLESINIFLRHVLIYLAKEKPLIILIEDVHWIDKYSASFIEMFSHNESSHPILMCLTSRNNDIQSTISDDSLTTITLERLDIVNTVDFVNEIGDKLNLDNDQKSLVIKFSEGVPLFIEELSKTRIDNKTRTTSELLQSNLMVRLDELDSKDITREAAVIGKEFDLDTLRKISMSKKTNEELQIILEGLVKSNIISHQKSNHNLMYSFKHALLQETAKNSLPKSIKKILHYKVASLYESNSQDSTTAEPEVVAYHFTEASHNVKAAKYWQIYGQKLANTWAKDDAVKNYQKGITLLQKYDRKLESKRPLCELELTLQTSLGDVLYEQFGYLTEEAKSAYEKALAISERLENHQVKINILDGVFGIHFNSGEFDRSYQIGQQLRNLSVELNQNELNSLGLQFQGMSKFHIGELLEAEKLLEESLHYKSEKHISDYPSTAYVYLSWAKCMLGKTEESFQNFSHAEIIANDLGPYKITQWHGNGCILYSMMGEYEKTRFHSEKLLDIAKEYGFNLWSKIGTFFNSWAKLNLGKAIRLDQMQEVVDSMLKTRQKCDTTLFIGLLAEAYYKKRLIDKAKDSINLALKISKETNERYYLAMLLGLKSRIYNDEQLALEAIKVAKEQNAKNWLLKLE